MKISGVSGSHLVALVALSLGLVHCSATSSSTQSSSGGGGAGGAAGSANGGAAGGGGTTGSGATGGIGFGGSGNTGGSPDCAGAEQKTSSGCDYYAVDPDISFDATGGCFAAYVVNPWDFAITVAVDYKGQALDPNAFGFIPNGTGPSIKYTPLTQSTIPPGQIAILFLNRFGGSPLGLNTSCPPGIVPAISTFDAAQHGTGVGSAFHITTSNPVVAYDIYPYGGGQSALTSATLLLPTTAWGDNYVAVSPFGNGAGFGTIGTFPVLSIVADQDATQVTIGPSVDILAGPGVAAAAKGTAAVYTINKGQVLQFTQPAALEGSVIQASVPVGVWAGMTTLGIEACCDESSHQQIPPVRALGNEYVAIRYRNRYDGTEESPPWRMMGAVDGTQLTWEPSAPPGAPNALNRGQVAQFDAPGQFVVKSQDDQHPFYMSAHMTGAGLYDPQTNNPNATADGRGDAEYVNIIPPGEYLDRYVFFTDPTYPETDLVIVRVKGPGGFADVTLDCAGTLSGWQPVGTSGQYEYTRFDLSRHDFQGQSGCDNGRHEITSNVPFGLTVWGWGSAETGQQLSGFYSQYVSYAYPGGASVAPINKVYVPPIPK